MGFNEPADPISTPPVRGSNEVFVDNLRMFLRVRSQSVWAMTLRVIPAVAIRSMAGELREIPVSLTEKVRLPFTPRTPFTSGNRWVSTPFPFGPIAKVIPRRRYCHIYADNNETVRRD